MSKNGKGLSTPLFYLALSIVTALIYLPLSVYPGGSAYFHADYAPGVIISDQFRQGQWSIFHWDMTYGGTIFTFLRAFWTSFFEPFFLGLGIQSKTPFSVAYLQAHLSYSFGVIPILLSLTMGFFLTGLVPGAVGQLATLICMVGTRYLDSHLPNEIYIGNLLFGGLLLGIRLRLKVPPHRTQPLTLLALGALSGVAAYQSRISALYLLPFWVSYPLNAMTVKAGFQSVKVFLGGKAPIERLLSALFKILFGLWLYLESFGPDLGKVFGKKVRLHASPNLSLAVLTLISLGLFRFLKNKDSKEAFLNHLKKFYERYLILGTGLAIGLSPEILARFKKLASGQPIGTYSFADAFTLLGLLPQRVRELLADPESLLSTGLLWILLITGAFALTKIRRLPEIPTFLWVGVLSIGAFFRIYTGMGWGATRYLLPLLPVLWGIIALGLSEIAAKRRFGVFASICCLGLIYLGWIEHDRGLYANTTSLKFIENIEKTNAAFALRKINLVVTDSFYETNQYTMVSREQIIYFAEGFPKPLTHPKVYALLAETHRLGYLTLKRPNAQVLKLAGKTWQVTETVEGDGHFLMVLNEIPPQGGT